MKQKKVRGLSVQKAADKLGVSIITLRRWDKSGILSPVRTHGGQRRYTVSQLNIFLKKRDNTLRTTHHQQSKPTKNTKTTTPPIQPDTLLIPKIVLPSSPSYQLEHGTGFKTLLNNGIEILSNFTEVGSFYAQKNPHVRKTGRKIQEGYITLNAVISFHHKTLVSIIRSLGVITTFLVLLSASMLLVGWYYSLISSLLG